MAAAKWSKARIIRTIKAFEREGLPLSYNAMARLHQALISAANYHLGSYRAAVLAAGIDYEEIRCKPHWSKKRIISTIQAAHREGRDLSWAKVYGGGDELACAAKAAARSKFFGGWRNALKTAGINPDQVARYRQWTGNRIIAELRSRSRKRQPLNCRSVQRAIPGIYRAAVRVFGSYNDALRSAGFDPKQIMQRREWNRPAVIKALKSFEQQHGLVSAVLLNRHDCGLLRAIRVEFGSLHAALEPARVRKYYIRG